MSAKYTTDVVTLNDGNRIPTIGLGTSRINIDELRGTIETAIDIGYRHFDSADIYRNHIELGNVLSMVISSQKVKRADLFITTKLGYTNIRPQDVHPCLLKCLENLKLEYVDMFLVHHPCAFKNEAKDRELSDWCNFYEQVDHLKLWKEMERMVELKLVRSIGLSNFNRKQITAILQSCKIKPVVNQIECHAYLQEKDHVQFCQDNNIVVSAYCPLGSPGLKTLGNVPMDGSDIVNDPIVIEVARQHNRTTAQILLRHHLQRGIIPLPKSSNRKRLEENYNIFDFTLSAQDMEILSKLDSGKRIFTYEFVKNHPDYPYNDM